MQFNAEFPSQVMNFPIEFSLYSVTMVLGHSFKSWGERIPKENHRNSTLRGWEGKSLAPVGYHKSKKRFVMQLTNNGYYKFRLCLLWSCDKKHMRLPCKSCIADIQDIDSQE